MADEPQPKEQPTDQPLNKKEGTTNHFGMRRQRGATRAPSGAAGQQLPLYDYIYFIFPLPLSLTFLRGSARLRTRRRRGARTRLIAQGGSRQGRKQSTNALVGWGRGGREGGGGGGRGFRRKARPRRRKRRRKPCVAAKPGIFHSLPSPVHILGLILSPLTSSPSPTFLGLGPRYPASPSPARGPDAVFAFLSLSPSSSSSSPSQFPTKPEEPSRPCRELKPPDARPPPAPSAAEIRARM